MGIIFFFNSSCLMYNNSFEKKNQQFDLKDLVHIKKKKETA